MPQNKRKREEESEEVVADECVAKKSRLRSNSSEGTFVVKAMLFCKRIIEFFSSFFFLK